MLPNSRPVQGDDPRAELERLRKIKRLKELEAKAGGAQPQVAAPNPMRSELDAGINELANQVPGGYENWQRQAPDAQRMAEMGYVQDPLAKTGFAKPRQPDVFETIQNNPATRNMATDAIRMMEAPIAGLTGGGLEGWAKTTSEDPLLGSNQAVEFISPVDDFARASYGFGQGVSGVATGDMDKAAQGFQQFATDGSYTAMQALPGSMTLKGISAPARVAPTTLAQAEKAAVAASRAPALKAPTRAPKRAPPPATPDNVAPFSAPAQPSGPGIVGRNMDRIIGGGVGAVVGGAGDAYAADGDGTGDGGPLNATTGAAIGIFGPRALASAGSRGFRAAARAARSPGARAAFDERVAARAVRKGLVSGGLKTEQDALAAATARFGDKPAAVADLTQDSVGTATGLSRLPGATGEAARARGEDLLANRAGRLERDIADATGASPATISGDVDRMVALAREQATPAYERLRAQYPFGSLVSKRLDSLRDLDILAPHIKGVERYRETLAATEGRQVGDFEFWDLVKRSLDDAEQSAIARNQAVPYDLDSARQAIVKELDQLVPDYPAARQLGGEAPKMKQAFADGKGLLGGKYTSEEISKFVEGVTGQPLTALQAGVIRSLVAKAEGPRGAMASLTSASARRRLEKVFGKGPADEMQARFAADAKIVDNAHRMNPNVGSVTPQAGMGGGEGGMAMAANLWRMGTAPVQTVLTAMSKSGSYTKAQRDLMGEMLLDGPTPENLARIYRGKTRNGAPTRTPPAPNTGLGSSTRELPGQTSNASPTVAGALVGGGLGYVGSDGDPRATLAGAVGGGAIGAVAGKMAKGGKAPRKPAPAKAPNVTALPKSGKANSSDLQKALQAYIDKPRTKWDDALEQGKINRAEYDWYSGGGTAEELQKTKANMLETLKTAEGYPADRVWEVYSKDPSAKMALELLAADGNQRAMAIRYEAERMRAIPRQTKRMWAIMGEPQVSVAPLADLAGSIGDDVAVETAKSFARMSEQPFLVARAKAITTADEAYALLRDAHKLINGKDGRPAWAERLIRDARNNEGKFTPPKAKETPKADVVPFGAPQKAPPASPVKPAAVPKQQEFDPDPWYHAGSLGDEMSADAGELGLHIGNEEAAKFVQGRGITRKVKPQISELRVRGNFAQTPDLGNFGSPYSYLRKRADNASEIYADAKFDPRYKAMWEELDAFAQSLPKISDPNSPELPKVLKQWRDKVHDAAKRNDISGWEYTNHAEGGGDPSRVVFDPSAVRKSAPPSPPVKPSGAPKKPN